MAVIDCRLIGVNRDGSYDAKNIRVWTQLWRVQTNDPLDGPAVVVNYSGLPALFDPYSSGNDSDPYALLVSKKPREEGEGHKSWIVTCEYRSDAISAEVGSNPLTDQVKYSCGFDQFSEIARQTSFGQRIINSVDQVFTPPPEVDQSRPVYIVQRNEAYINLPGIVDLSDSVNQYAWKGCAPRTVKVKSITPGEIQNRNGLEFYSVRYEFHINWLTWDLRILNQATRYNSAAAGADPVYVPLPQGTEPMTLYVKDDRPVPRGAIVSSDAAFYDEKSSAAGNVVYLRYRHYKERNFSAMFPF